MLLVSYKGINIFFSVSSGITIFFLFIRKNRKLHGEAIFFVSFRNFGGTRKKISITKETIFFSVFSIELKYSYNQSRTLQYFNITSINKKYWNGSLSLGILIYYCYPLVTALFAHFSLEGVKVFSYDSLHLFYERCQTFVNNRKITQLNRTDPFLSKWR